MDGGVQRLRQEPKGTVRRAPRKPTRLGNQRRRVDRRGGAGAVQYEPDLAHEPDRVALEHRRGVGRREHRGPHGGIHRGIDRLHDLERGGLDVPCRIDDRFDEYALPVTHLEHVWRILERRSGEPSRDLVHLARQVDNADRRVLRPKHGGREDQSEYAERGASHYRSNYPPRSRRQGVLATRNRELHRHLHKHANGAAFYSTGTEHRTRERLDRGGGERRVRTGNHLQRIALHVPHGVDHTLHDHDAFYVRKAEHLRVARRGRRQELRLLLDD